MNKIETIYLKAVELYNEIADLIELTYDEMKELKIVKISKKKILQNFDLYMQCLLFKVALMDKKLDNVEYEFITKITRYYDLSKEYGIKKKVILDELISKIETNCDNVLNDIPLFIQMLCLIDQMDEKRYLCLKVFKRLMYIVCYLSQIDLNASNDEILGACSSLNPIMDYFKINKIKFIEKE